MTSEIPKSVIEEAAKLRDAILHHSHLYYTLDAPEITDSEFDALFNKLKLLEKQYPLLSSNNSPTKKIQGEQLFIFEKVTHAKPMLSIFTETDYSFNGVLSFDARVHKDLNLSLGEKIEYEAELKFDGLAINLRYEKGILTQASTRGDGEIGEDVTRNVKTISQIPAKLNTDYPPEVLEVRGEIYMSRDSFKRLNFEQTELIRKGFKGIRTFANPRNAAAGTLRQFDSEVVRKRNLSFFAYSWGEIKGWNNQPKTQYEMLEVFSQLGFPVPQDSIVTNSLTELFQFH